jgi:hypothetical protein
MGRQGAAGRVRSSQSEGSLVGMSGGPISGAKVAVRLRGRKSPGKMSRQASTPGGSSRLSLAPWTKNIELTFRNVTNYI